MGLFKRAQWKSGLTYKQTCDACNTTVQYTDEILDFRPWFADGFVYCPKCKKPLRHRESYAINAPAQPPETYILGDEPTKIPTEPQEKVTNDGGFCTKCGKRYGAEDRFCSGCGNKLK